MAQLTQDEYRKAVELGFALLSEYLYRQEFTVLNSLSAKEQSLAVTGLLNISAKMVYMFSHARQDDDVEGTMGALTSVIYTALEESLKDDK
jgi:hypothetical protein